jgi:hypothetical protein
MTSGKPWHIRIGKNGRAFYKPKNFKEACVCFLKGWRRFDFNWWSKPSKNQALAENLHGIR